MRVTKLWAVPAGIGMMAIGALTLGPTLASAHGGPTDPAKTADARQCLAEQGVSAPAKGTKPTADDLAAINAARAACGLPELAGRRGPRAGTANPPGPDPAKAAELRQCLADTGVTVPTGPDARQALTQEERNALAEAFTACGAPFGLGRRGPGGFAGPGSKGPKRGAAGATAPTAG
jgi:hypothetical protein